MTSAEWMTTDDPVPMLAWARGEKVRKCRLLGVAWARLLWPLLTDERSRLAVEAAEQFAEGLISLDQMQRCADGAYDVHAELRDALGWLDRRVVAAFAAMVSAWNPDYSAPVDTLQRLARTLTETWPADGFAPDGFGTLAGHRAYADLAREVFANPLRPVAFSPGWRTSTAVALAEQMYESRDFGAMPILADALQDAGCDSEDILSHCRGPGPHARGCWVVDLVLGKE